uniref:cytokinin dehydrogenase n=1 Tax=Ananas comosus var. bracteatus TaxID=296719 RepID=A0A6V7NV06_ANACO|nr:unnamed protein product [Ananas comosus var. bracteatus]
MSRLGCPSSAATPETVRQSALPLELRALDISPKIRADPDTLESVSSDFGGVISGRPYAIFYPSNETDIARLIRTAFESAQPFTITARGRGHSDRGQSVGVGGVTVDMRALAGDGEKRRINVCLGGPLGPYVDIGAEQMWSELMHETLEHGFGPRTWLDYLDITVGGSLTVGGISGQALRHGPQVRNVHELDIITGKGELVTCSENQNPDLFYASLGGLGQFGIITRARIALEPAPSKVKWVGLVYSSFEAFTKDEEYLISLDGAPGKRKGFDYLEGFVFLDHKHATINYCDDTVFTVDEEVEALTEGLNYAPGFKFTKDLSYVGFLDRVQLENERLRKDGLRDVPHPWLNLLVPKSRIYDFHEGVFKGVYQKDKPMGVILVYPLDKYKWDEKMSLVFPKEDVFYKIGLLLSTTPDNLEGVLKQNEEILRFCEGNGIDVKQYMPHYENTEDWKEHFGEKWDWFVEMKKKYDPKNILAPGQKIFTSPLI